MPLPTLGKATAIETIDGGVGDDQEVSILKSGGDAVSLDSDASAGEWPLFITPDIAVSLFRPPAIVAGPKDFRSLAAGSVRRFAWLQFFLF